MTTKLLIVNLGNKPVSMKRDGTQVYEVYPNGYLDAWIWREGPLTLIEEEIKQAEVREPYAWYSCSNFNCQSLRN